MDKTFFIVGHRGAPAQFPENSLEGIIHCLEIGADGVEFDVQISSDGVPVVFHDQVLDRVCDREGNIYDFSERELDLTSAHEPSRFSNKFYPQPIVSLQKVATQTAGFNASIFIEIKEESYSAVDKYHFADKVIKASQCLAEARVIISYDEDILRYCRRHHNTKIGWVVRKYNPGAYKIYVGLKPDFVICNYKKIAAPENLWQIDCPWFLYDLVDVDEVQRWVQAGVKYIETWNPEGLLKGQYE